ncbi:hypothetical protein IFO70_09575 [Phormidium tenue FACHB-886]|nr:hypothetical protein [Phormidium tenue FACHB-886]
MMRSRSAFANPMPLNFPALKIKKLLPFFHLLPVYATQVLQGNAHTLGFLTAASEIGALLGVGYISALGQQW